MRRACWPKGSKACPTLGNITTARCVLFQWPQLRAAYDPNRGHQPSEAWHGSLLDSKRDGSGLLDRRDRMYDPQTGRFTQEDPIGLAGGLNLYGFAGGDPVNFGDPFGLKVCFSSDAARRATEDATGTSIAVDKNRCAKTIVNTGGAAYAELQDILGRQHRSETDVFFVAVVNEKGVSSSFKQVTDIRGGPFVRAWQATLNIQSTLEEYYVCGSNNGFRQDLGQLAAHELIGHGSRVVIPTILDRLFELRPADGQRAKQIENISEDARGRPCRI